MYNIKQAAARAGVTVPVLRAWERRYGIVTPERTASGYRQFDDASDRARPGDARPRRRRLVAERRGGGDPCRRGPGAPAEAPAASTAGGHARRRRAARRSGRGRDGALGAGSSPQPRALDPAALDAVLDELFSRGSFERVADDLLFPALGGSATPGRAARSASPASTSRATRCCAGSGWRSRPRDRAVAVGPGVVVGLPPGGRHELGALAFAVAARRAGLAVTYLGADLPGRRLGEPPPAGADGGRHRRRRRRAIAGRRSTVARRAPSRASGAVVALRRRGRRHASRRRPRPARGPAGGRRDAQPALTAAASSRPEPARGIRGDLVAA